MTDFYPFSEQEHRSEKLPEISWQESLIVDSRSCRCGACETVIEHAENLTQCPAPECGIVWKQVIYRKGADSFRHQHLMMYGSNVIGPLSISKRGSTPTNRLLGRRVVQDAKTRDDLL